MAESYNPFAEFQGPEWEQQDPYDKFLRFNQVFYALPEFANQRVGVREKFRNKVLGFKDTGEMLKSVMGSAQGRGVDQRTSAETFNEIGAAIKAESPAAMTLFAGYSNGCVGYLPTQAAHALGGYEVTLAPYFYRMPGLLDPGSEALVTNRSLGILRRLWPEEEALAEGVGQ